MNNNKINFDNLGLPKYTENDLNNSYEYMKCLFPDEFEEYEKSKLTSTYIYDDCLEFREFVFDNIYVNLNDDKIELYVYSDIKRTKKIFLKNFDMNKHMDITIKYFDNIYIDVSFYNDEQNGNLKCVAEWNMFYYLKKTDEKMIKKQIEALLYGIDDYVKNYIKNVENIQHNYTLDYYDMKDEIEYDIEQLEKYSKHPDNSDYHFDSESENEYEYDDYIVPEKYLGR